MIANETTLNKRLNDKEINNYYHRTAFNNGQSPYRTVIYTRPRNVKFKTIQSKKKLTTNCYLSLI